MIYQRAWAGQADSGRRKRAEGKELLLAYSGSGDGGGLQKARGNFGKGQGFGEEEGSNLPIRKQKVEKWLNVVKQYWTQKL